MSLQGYSGSKSVRYKQIRYKQILLYLNSHILILIIVLALDVGFNSVLFILILQT